jgi:hypothetical protein
MHQIAELHAEVTRRADARTPDVIERLLRRLLAPPKGGCTKHEALRRDYAKAGIDLTRARRAFNRGEGPFTDTLKAMEDAKRRYQELGEAFHDACFRCGCETD